MDPYLEAHWRDIHARLVIYACDALQAVLPGALRARVEESVVLETPLGLRDHSLFPDVRVVDFPLKPGNERRTKDRVGDSSVVLEDPVLVDLGPDAVTETHLEIIDRESGNRVVTVIEFLSPTNKIHGPSREQYVHKQQKICASDANLVEIDLNRFGIHTLAFPLVNLVTRTSYLACVRRTTRPDKAEVYRMPIWQRLPIIKIPLRPDDADAPLDLQDLIDKCYRNGAYEDTIDYAAEPHPPLVGLEKEWADKWLVEKGLRTKKKPTRRRDDKPKRRSGGGQ